MIPRLVVVAVLAAFAAAQERVSLDGNWQLASDAQQEALVFDKTASVPAPFEDALGAAFDGVAWYQRTLPLLPEHQGARVRIEFLAVATHATVFCNGMQVGEHLGGWTPFRCDLTAALRGDGTDVLQVRVDEKVGHNTQGFLPIVQPHFGGIWQSVTLCIDRQPVLDRLACTAFGRADGSLQATVTTLAGDQSAVRVEVIVHDGARELARAGTEVAPGLAAPLQLQVPSPRPWSPTTPSLYRLAFVLRHQDGRELDRLERRIGFRSLAADGTSIRWNGAPLQVRGVLHWGNHPGHLAPPLDPGLWRRQLEDYRSLGFNLLKCCLWVPPRQVYELCDELGLLVWQEYPTWHPQMDQAHKQELLAEYAEFFVHDRSHPSVAFRSLTCETGHGADLDVIRSLYDACKSAVPDTLVVDDSSWIGWQRIADFWDEHPYGNNRWWPGRLAEFQRHIDTHGKKPLLLGECMAADTWFDLDRWRRAHGERTPWWQPLCVAEQQRFADWCTAQFGPDTLASLLPISLDYGMRTRRYQIELLRRSLPDAGYVVSVARDFAKARMGLYDDFEQLKWSAADWSWHRDTMPVLVTPDDRRAFVSAAASPVVLHTQTCSPGAVGALEPLPPLPAVERPTRVRLERTFPQQTWAWDVWALPRFDDARPGGVTVVDQLDLATLDHLERGGRVLLRVSGQRHSLRSEGKWYLTGAPFAPAHPVHAVLPRELLIDLQPFDLDGGRLMPWTVLRDQVDPILAFWETHDIAEVRTHLFAFDTRVGNGRLLASCFDTSTDAGRYVESALLHHLALGPAAGRALAPATLAALRGLLTESKLELPLWRFRTDADDQGRTGNWMAATTDVSAAPWRDMRAGSHWENQGDDVKHYTGIAWYRVDFTLPADWAAAPARIVFEGVDDSFDAWLDGEPIGSFGDPVTKTTIWLQRQVAEVGDRFRAGGKHTLVLRVVDHAGAGGLWKPVFITTGPVDASSNLLQ
ncbi:MAG: hypothetical protein IPK26_25600 [Planctomycetes bacterium]|nr:hypothetical protein [Planctomycetota bacterium]